jgi:TolB-like protein
MKRPRLHSIAFSIGLLLASSAGAQRIAPLPPPCALGGADTARRIPRPPRQPASLAVLPLTVGSGAASFVFLSDGLPDAIAARIGTSMPRLYVVGRRAQHRRLGANEGAIRTLGADLGVEYLLAGDMGRSRNNLRLTFTLYDATTGRKTWQRAFFYDSAGALPIEQAVAIEAAARIGGPLSDAEQRAILRVPSARRGAYEAFLRGNVAADEFARSLAGDAYRRALRIDPSFADAHARLALTDADVIDENDTNGPDEGSQLTREMQASADRAVTLDSSLAIAWLAEARAWMIGGRPSAAWTQAFQRSLARDSADPAVLAAYGVALLQDNNRARARGILERATKLDPSRADLWTSLAEIAVAERRDPDACSLLNRAILEDPLYPPAWAVRALVRGRHDDLRFAWADAETAERLGSTLLGESAGALIDLTARDTVRARERLMILWQDVRDRKSVSAHEGRAVAVALLAAGDKSRALDVLESVRPLGPRYAASLKDSSFDRLRNEPRFRALVSIRSGS